VGKKINDGDISGLKQDKFRNSRFEYDNRENDSYRLGGVSRRHGGSQLDHEGSHFGKGPKGYKRSDDSIYEDVCYDLTVSPDVDASDIQVTVKDGIVFLTGQIQDRKEKKMAEYEIENVSGVIDVQNQLTIKTHAEGKKKEKDLH
jgi:osmotically-inducible protein OsmY